MTLHNCDVFPFDPKKISDINDEPINPFGATIEEQLITLENAQIRIILRLVQLEDQVKDIMEGLNGR